MTVIRSQIAITSSSLWLTNITATPFFFRPRMISNSFSISRCVMAVVGSSMMMSFASWQIARQIATICFSATDSCSTSLLSGSSTPTCLSASRASASLNRLLTNRFLLCTR